MMLAAISSLSIMAQAGTQEDSFLKDLVVSGFLDVYYQHSFNNPGVGQSLAFRQLDTKHASFTLSALQLNVQKKTSAESPFGFLVQVSAGRATDILHGAEPGGVDTYKLLQQAYVTYASPDGTTVDVGKFLSWVGYEGVQPVLNDLYSISFLFFFAQPSYHFGVRASRPLGPATASVFLVNGWNEVEDSNANKSYGASFSLPIGGKTTATLNYYGGVEGSGGVNGFYGVAGGGKSGVNLADLIVVHQLPPKVKLALNADYADVKRDWGPSGKFRGVLGTVRAQLTDKFAAAVRYETVSDPNGLRSAVDGRFNSLTGGVEYFIRPESVLRLELRSDNSNQNVFEAENGPKKTRTTITLAHILRF